MDRHPNKCKYLKQGYQRRVWCDYLHIDEDDREHTIDLVNEAENVYEKEDFEITDNEQTKQQMNVVNVE